MGLVTVMMPNFNSEQYIERAIESIKAQDNPNFICNIVDDGSTDNSVSVILKSIKNDSRFNLIKLGQNQKIANARNIAAKISNTPFLAALDSDDEWLPNHLSLRLDYISKHSADFLYGQMQVIGSPLVIDKDDNSKYIHINETSQGATIFIRTDSFWKLGGYRNMYGEDGDLLERAKSLDLKIHKVEFETYIYHRREGSTTDLMAKGQFDSN